jgi:Ca2+-binding RTX toxin-like protein
VGTGATSLLDQAKEGKMRRVTLMLAVMAMMVSLFAVVAYAAQIEGSESSEDLVESNRGDTIKALAGDDSINAKYFTIEQTPSEDGDRDRAHGNKGDDYIYVDDNDGKDFAFGGEGTDRCWVDLAQDVGDGGDRYSSCEFINGEPQ